LWARRLPCHLTLKVLSLGICGGEDTPSISETAFAPVFFGLTVTALATASSHLWNNDLIMEPTLQAQYGRHMRVFLSASADADTHTLREALEELGADVLATTDVASGGGIRSVLLPTDRLVGLLQYPAVGNTAVLVEIGIAIGMGLPVLVIAPPASPIPAALGDVIVVRSAADDLDALQLPLKLFVRTAASRPSPSPTSSASHEQVDLARFREQLATLEEAGNDGRDLVQLVADLLRYSGAQVEEQPSWAEGWRPDIALAIPGQEGRLGTVIVELKISRDRKTLESAAFQLVQYVLALRGGLGLLLYPGSELELPTTPMTACLSLNRLLSELSDRSLADVLVRARNEAIHRL